MLRSATAALRRAGRPAAAARRLASVLCSDAIDDSCISVFESRGHKVVQRPELGKEREELLRVMPEFDALVVRSGTQVDADVINAGTSLKIIGRAGVGVDNIDLKEATRRGVMVMNTPSGNTVSTAQLAVSLMCNLARDVPAADMSCKEGKWERKRFMGIEMAGKTLAVVGCGRIGQVVASAATAMGMDVIGFDPVMSAEAAASVGIRKVELDQVWAEADFISLHTPLTPDTRNLVNDETLARCKDGVRIINCARGGIVDQDALLRGLESGKVGGAALDVYDSEPPGESAAALLAHERLVCTPHLGASTDEAQVNVARDVAVQMCDALDGIDYVGAVNVSYMALTGLPPMRPFMRLAATMGSLAAQMVPGKVSSVTLRTWGGRDVDVTSRDARDLLLALVLQGVVSHLAPEAGATLVSAPLLAAEKGVRAGWSPELPDRVGSPYLNLVSVEVECEGGGAPFTMTGSVFGSEPHIVQIQSFRDAFSFRPDTPFLLTFRNEDRPGAVSGVLSVLQSANVNIASLNVARQADERALCLMALDDDLPEEALEQLRLNDAISEVRKVALQTGV